MDNRTGRLWDESTKLIIYCAFPFPCPRSRVSQESPVAALASGERRIQQSQSCHRFAACWKSFSETCTRNSGSLCSSFNSGSRCLDVVAVLSCHCCLGTPSSGSMRSWLFLEHNFGQVISCVSCSFVASRMTVNLQWL
ncbi:hypothetical protein QQF64_012456 [Cirrhinus molitorella]|uniref:Uncharacterized protein n=1 Tax=Cirrhinus molitorella TaxID=172907 RepID=A0ABR3LVL2_9TELE